MRRALICGDRNWTDHEPIRAWLDKLKDWGYDTLIEGEAPGADSIARDEAYAMGFTVLKFPANWRKYGRAAGPIRNRQMLEEGKPDIVVGFHPNILASRGTKDMLTQAKKRGIETVLVEK